MENETLREVPPLVHCRQISGFATIVGEEGALLVVGHIEDVACVVRRLGLGVRSPIIKGVDPREEARTVEVGQERQLYATLVQRAAKVAAREFCLLACGNMHLSGKISVSLISRSDASRY